MVQIDYFFAVISPFVYLAGDRLEQIAARVEKELTLIGEVDYASYFLTVHDIVQFARSEGILCQGRGSAANSVVCYLLGITEVPPESITLILDSWHTNYVPASRVARAPAAESSPAASRGSKGKMCGGVKLT